MPVSIVSPSSVTSFVRDHITDEVMMTPAEALHLLGCRYDCQRPIVDRHARVFADLHAHGAWRATSVVTIVVGRRSGVKVVINGYHRLTFISRSTTSVGITIHKIIVDDAVLADEAEAEFRIHDTNTKSRSIKDLLWAHENVRALGLDPHIADKIAAGAHFIELGFPISSSGVDAKNRSADMRVPSLIKHVKAGKEYLGYIAGARKSGKIYKALMKQHIMAAGLAICARFPGDPRVRTFFHTVSRDDGLPATDPRKMLVNLITDGFKNASGREYSKAAQAIIVRRAFDNFLVGASPSFFRVSVEDELNAKAVVTL